MPPVFGGADQKPGNSSTRAYSRNKNLEPAVSYVKFMLRCYNVKRARDELALGSPKSDSSSQT